MIRSKPSKDFPQSGQTPTPPQPLQDVSSLNLANKRRHLSLQPPYQSPFPCMQMNPVCTADWQSYIPILPIPQLPIVSILNFAGKPQGLPLLAPSAYPTNWPMPPMQPLSQPSFPYMQMNPVYTTDWQPYIPIPPMPPMQPLSQTSFPCMQMNPVPAPYYSPLPMSQLSDFSHGLLKDTITRMDIIFPRRGGRIIKREGMSEVTISEIFYDKEYYRTNRYKKKELLEKAIEIYKTTKETDYDKVLETLPYENEYKDVIRKYLKSFSDGKQPEELLKSYEALGPEEDKDKLFWRMPCLDDILQGEIGDCYLLGSLQTIVNKDPTIILRMMRDNGNGTVTVKLFDEDSVNSFYEKGLPPPPHYYIIEKTLCHGFAMNCMWVQMIERAFLIHRRRFRSTYDEQRKFKNQRIDIDAGYEEDVFSSILATPQSELELIRFRSKVEITLDKKMGLATICANEEATNWICEKDHTYAILGYMKSPTGFYIYVTEPTRGGGGKFEYATGINYDPRAESLEKPQPCLGLERMWLKVNDFLTPKNPKDIETFEYIKKVFATSKFKYLEEKGKLYYEEQQRRNKAVK